VLLRSGIVLTPMDECREFAVVVLMGNQRVGLEDRLEPLARVAGLVADLGEIFEVAGDLSFVPGDQDRLDV
jgi:hypothetical protein